MVTGEVARYWDLASYSQAPKVTCMKASLTFN